MPPHHKLHFDRKNMSRRPIVWVVARHGRCNLGPAPRQSICGNVHKLGVFLFGFLPACVCWGLPRIWRLVFGSVLPWTPVEYAGMTQAGISSAFSALSRPEKGHFEIQSIHAVICLLDPAGQHGDNMNLEDPGHEGVAETCCQETVLLKTKDVPHNKTHIMRIYTYTYLDLQLHSSSFRHPHTRHLVSQRQCSACQRVLGPLGPC